MHITSRPDGCSNIEAPPPEKSLLHQYEIEGSVQDIGLNRCPLMCLATYSKMGKYLLGCTHQLTVDLARPANADCVLLELKRRVAHILKKKEKRIRFNYGNLMKINR